VQLIAGAKFVSFLTPDMASKNDDGHGWHRLFEGRIAHASFFDAMSGVIKLPNSIAALNCPTSANEPSIDNSMMDINS